MQSTLSKEDQAQQAHNYRAAARACLLSARAHARVGQYQQAQRMHREVRDFLFKARRIERLLKRKAAT